MTFTIETEGVHLTYDKRVWKLTGSEPLSRRMVWLMNQIQAVEAEYKKRSDQAESEEKKAS